MPPNDPPRPAAQGTPARPWWSEVLQALREARAVTQDGWAAHLGVSRKTVQRWEAGERVPDPGAEAGLLTYCGEKGLFRPFDRGPLAGISLTAESLQALLAEARIQARLRLQTDGRADGASAVMPTATEPSNLAGGRHQAQPEGLSPPARSLPAPLSSFIGREQELATVRRTLSDTRLLTLTGIGGCGKTRLALHLAGELLWAYPSGVWFVELATLADPALVPQTVGATLGLHPTGQQPIVEVLLEHLPQRHLLLILDNCEHLLPACAALVETLLRACPHLEVVTTSREPLGITGETVWRVPPLSLPDATRLFVERSRSYQPDVDLTAANEAAIDEICEQLDGIPLAIELAAARVRALSVEQIAVRLADRFRLLTNGSRTALPRQQTLRATLDWSHDLLTEPEQALLRRLSVFAGGWSLEAAEAVCTDLPSQPSFVIDTFDILNSLVDKSLVIAEPQDSAVRYYLLETVRRYAAEKLEEEHDNLRVALAWSLTGGAELSPAGGSGGGAPDRRGLGNSTGSPIQEEGAAALRLAAALVRFWERRGHMTDARQWLAQALAVGQNAAAVIRAKALRAEGSLAYFQGDYATGRLRLEESLSLYRGLGDTLSAAEVQGALGRVALRQGEHAAARAALEASLAVHIELGHTPGIASVGSGLGLLALREGDHVTARAFFEEGLTLQRRLGNVEGIAEALEDLATVAGEQGEHEEQVALLEESLPLFYQLGSKGGIALVLGNLGVGAWLQGDPGRALSLLRESLALYRDLGDRRGVARLLGNQALVLLSQRDAARATDLCRESLALYRESVDEWGIARYLPVLAGALFVQGQSDRAALLFGAGAALRERIGTPLPPVVQPGHDRAVAAVRAALGDEAFAAAWTAGKALPAAAAVGVALAEAVPA